MLSDKDIEKAILKKIQNPKMEALAPGAALPGWLKYAIQFIGSRLQALAVGVCLSALESAGIKRHDIHVQIEKWVEEHPDNIP